MGLGPQAMHEIARVIQENTITTIDLRDNKIGPDGAKILASAIKNSSGLHVLNLRNNAIGIQGTKALAEALVANKQIHLVDLSYNNLGFEFIEEITEYYKLDRLCWRF